MVNKRILMRSGRATCGQCGCLLTRHSNKDTSVWEQVKVQVQRSGKMKTWGDSQTQRTNILNSQIVFCQNATCLSLETNFIPEPRAETLPPSKYGLKRASTERDGCVSWDKIVF